MIEQKNLRVIFTQKAESVFFDILKNNELEESDEEFDAYIFKEKESRAMIIRDTIEIMARKIIPEDKLVELLQKHLEVSQDATEKIIKDIKEKLLPLLLMYPDEKFNDPIFREEISKKVSGDEKNIVLPYDKKIDIKDVDKNAEKLKETRETIVQQNTIGQGLQKKGTDTYRELIE